MKRTMICGAVLGLAVALVTNSCLGKKESATSGGSGGAAVAGGAVTLKLGIWDKNQERGITDTLKGFTQETGVQVSVEVTPWDQYWTLLEAAATGGSLPDVFWMHSNQAQRYGTNGILLDLTARIAGSSAVDMAQFPKDLVELYTFDGKHYAIPKDLDTIALWYNKTFFDEAGLAYPDETWTWETLKDAAQKLTDPAKNRYGMDWRPNDCQQGWGNVIYSNGGYIINGDKTRSGYDQPKTIAAMEYVVSFAREGISPPLSITAETGGDGLLKSGMVAMAGFGSWMLSDFKMNEYIAANCELAVLPKSADGKRVSIYNGLGWVGAANTKYPEEVWKLLEFLSREDTQRKLSQSGIAISAFNGTAEPFAESFSQFNVKAYIEQIPYAVFRPYSKNTVVWEEMSYQTFNDAWNGTRPVADVCRDIAQKMNLMLAVE